MTTAAKAEKTDMAENSGRKLPATRIASLFLGLNYFAAGLVTVAMLPGFFAPVFPRMLYYHIALGLAAVVMGLFALVAVMFYLVVTSAGIKEAVREKGLPVEYYQRTAPFKKTLFPRCMLTITLLIAMTALGGAVHTGQVNRNIHLFFALVTAASYYHAIKKTKEVFQKDRALIADALDAIDAATP